MSNKVIKLKDSVIPDMTLDDINRLVLENPLKKYSFDEWDAMIGETDAAWCLQDQSPLMEMIPFGRMRLNLMRNRDNQASGGAIDTITLLIKTKSEQVTNKLLDSRTAFDMMINYPVLEAKETYIDVPRTIKKGLFKRETIYEIQKQIAYSYSENSILFDGWRVAHFERAYKARSLRCQRKLNWDFVLGSDGKIYHITYGYTQYEHPSGPEDEYSKFFCIVREAIFYDLCFLSNKNQAYFIAVSHGALLTLNNILPKLDEQFQDTIRTNDNEEYTYNFPVQPPLGVTVDGTMQNLFSKLDSLGTD